MHIFDALCQSSPGFLPKGPPTLRPPRSSGQVPAEYLALVPPDTHGSLKNNETYSVATCKMIPEIWKIIPHITFALVGIVTDAYKSTSKYHLISWNFAKSMHPIIHSQANSNQCNDLNLESDGFRDPRFEATPETC